MQQPPEGKSPSLLVGHCNEAGPFDTREKRQYERHDLAIRVNLQGQESRSSSTTSNLGLGGLRIITDLPFRAGTPINLHFSFAEACYLNLVGHVVYCLPPHGSSKNRTVGIKFSAIRDWERRVLASVIEAFTQEDLNRSLLIIGASKDTLATEASTIHESSSTSVKLSHKMRPNEGTKESPCTPVLPNPDRFSFSKTLYLTDTNALGNAYFSRYFDWQGMAREEFLRRIVPDPLAFFKTGMRIFTVSATIEYKAELTLYDEIEIEVYTRNIRRASFELLFYFMNHKTNTVVAVGSQKLVFIDPENRIMPIPEEFKAKGYAYLVSEASGHVKRDRS